MWTLSTENAVEHLHFAGYWPPHVPAQARMLTGGVSNMVIRVEPIEPSSQQPSMILKQSSELLRTKAEWRSRLDRIWIETETMKFLGDVLPPQTVPVILFEEQENYLFGMTDLGQTCDVWKLLLLEGRVEPGLARSAGLILGTIHESGLRHNESLQNGRLADWTVFDELRIDPYYRTIAKVHSIIAEPIQQLIHQMEHLPQKTLVHADFSPKNMLIDSENHLGLVDFETAHWGDPAFDLGFFLSHLVLKTFRAMRLGLPTREEFLDMISVFWEKYQDTFWSVENARALEYRAVQHLAACMLARVDGKSPVDYLAEADQDSVRVLTIEAMKNQTSRLEAFILTLKDRFHQETD